MQGPIFLVIDLFCGFGGTTRGYELAELGGDGIAKVFACVNHDPKAIKSHWLNHPGIKHFEEDIRTLELSGLTSLTRSMRSLYPDSKLILWASLECTNFSKAKGGQPRDADSRTLADHLPRYIKALDPDYIKIENVVEFMSWGPLGPNGKPVSRKNGTDWMRWRRDIRGLGYVDDWAQLNSANFGAFTSRNRLFGIFAKPDLPIVWPQPTHAKNPGSGIMFSGLKKWAACRECLDFEDEGQSILTRETPLVDATLERIYAGLVKFVAKGDTAFLTKYFSGKPTGKNIPVTGPCGTITTSANTAIVRPEFIVQRHGGDPAAKLVDPNGPARTLTSTGGNQDLVRPEFLTSYYGHGSNTSPDDPAPTLSTHDRFGLVQPEHFLEKQYGKGQNQGVDVPSGALMPNDKHRLVTAEPFIMPTNYANQPRSIDEPAPTITADRHHHYVVNHIWGGNVSGVDVQGPTIIARQDKTPLYLIRVEEGPVSVAVYETDSPVMIRIKQFMAAFGLVDIKMRMLRVPELLKIQGFPDNYKMIGSQADQKKFIGNSVHPLVPKAWVEALGIRLIELRKKVA